MADRPVRSARIRSEVIDAVRAERNRQVVLGYDEAHDDAHTLSWWTNRIAELAQVAHFGRESAARQKLVEIAALAVAAIERLDRTGSRRRHQVAIVAAELADGTGGPEHVELAEKIVTALEGT